MNRKLVIFIAVAVIAGIGAFYALWALTHPSRSIPTLFKAPGVITTAVTFDSSSIVVPGPNSFTRYNVQTGDAASLGPDLAAGGLANIDSLSVSSDQKYILFHNNFSAQGDALYTILASRNLSPSVDYWWVYSISDKTLRPLPGGVLLAKFTDNNTIYGIVSAGSSEVFNSYDIGSLSQKSSMPIVGANNFFKTTEGVVLQTPSGDILYTSDGIANRKLLSPAVLVGMIDKNNIVATTTVENVKKLVEVNINKNTSKAIATNIVDTPAWLKPGTALYTTSNPDTDARGVFSYNFASHRRYPWNYTGTAKSLDKQNIKPVLLINQTTAVVSSLDGNTYIIGQNIANPTKLGNP